MESRPHLQVIASQAARAPWRALLVVASALAAIATAAPAAVAAELPEPFAAAGPAIGRPDDRLPGALGVARKKWLFGRVSHTYEQSPVSGNTYVSTLEQVGYKGKRDASWPRVGDVYLASIWVGRSGDDGAGDEVVTEVMLPRKTRFAIDRTHRVRCYTGGPSGGVRELKGRTCPNRPSNGTHGARFVPPKGSWDVPRRHWVQVIFPVQSSRPLKGLADTPNACLMGAVMNLSGWRVGPLWDAPRRGENCPTADGHGPYQGVFVARRR